MAASPTATVARVATSRARWFRVWVSSSCRFMLRRSPVRVRRRVRRGKASAKKLADRTIRLMARLLLAGDDDGIRVPLARALEREGHAVDAVADGATAARLGIDEEYALVVLDIGLP